MNNELLTKRFPKEALKALPGNAKLTTINAYYVIERLNDVYGPGNWWTESEIVEFTEKECIVFGYLVLPDGQRTAKTAGNMEQNFARDGGKPIHSRGDLLKGATTSLIGKAASLLGIGIDVYKGIQDHNTEDLKTPIDWKRIPEAKEAEFLPRMAKKWDGVIVSETDTNVGIRILSQYFLLTKEQFNQLKEDE